MMQSLQFAWQFLKRDWQAGEVKVIFLSVVIAVASVVSIGALNEQIQMALGQQEKKLLGADFIVKSPQPLSEQWLSHAKSVNVELDQVLDFSSVVVVNGQFKLANIKAVGSVYPLRGQIRVSQGVKQVGQWGNQGPKKGEVWLEPRLFDALNATVGDSITIGRSTLRITGVLQEELARATYLFVIAPKLLMHRDDIPATQVVQPGSRIQYQYLGIAEPGAAKAFQQWLSPQLGTGQSVVSRATSAPALKTALDKAEQYLALSSLISVLLAGIAIAVAAGRYGDRHLDHTALFACLGSTPRKIMQLYAMQMLMIAVIAGFIGVLLGYVLEWGVIALLKDLLPGNLPSPTMQPALMGLLTSIFSLLGFALATVHQLRNVPPVRVLRRDSQSKVDRSRLLTGLSVFSLLLLMWWVSGNLGMSVLLMLCAGAIILLARVFVYIAVTLLGWTQGRLSAPAKLAFKQLVRHQQVSTLQVFAIGLALMIMMVVLVIRVDLVGEWQKTIPDDAHNHFALNIQPYEVDQLDAFFKVNRVSNSPLMPMVRGRLTELNGQPIKAQVASGEKAHNALRRALNLTWSEQLPEGNRLVKGQWWSEYNTQTGISVELDLAKSLGLTLGDELTFLIGETPVSGVIKNIRSVQWDSFKPNFYVVFSPGALESQPVAYLTSFLLDKSNKNTLNTLVNQFPTVTVIEIDEIMAQVKNILTQVTLAIEYLAFFVLASGFCVLLAAMQATLDERRYNSAVIRAMGADGRFIQRLMRYELLLIGLLAGLLASFGTELVTGGLYWRIFDAPLSLHPTVWIVGPMVGGVVVWLSGIRQTKQIVSQSPLLVLKR